MKEQNTYVEYSRSEIDMQQDETEWSRFDVLTDADIDTAAVPDTDDPKTDAAFWKDATVVMPENEGSEYGSFGRWNGYFRHSRNPKQTG